jgi:predicted metalloprotease with PDZ domain
MTIKFADQKIREAQQRLASLDRALADLRKQSRRVANSPDTRVELLAMREQSAQLADERCKAYAELVELIGLAEMSPEHMGLA